MTMKLCDFGIATSYDIDSTTTLSMTSIGTKKYLAPEIRRNIESYNEEGRVKSKYTESCDIFSAALVACELATGKIDTGIQYSAISILIVT